MVYRTNIDEDEWNAIKHIKYRDTFASELLNYVGPMESIQRVEIRLPSTVTKEERHSVYMLNKKSILKSVVINDDEAREDCMFIFISKAYVQKLSTSTPEDEPDHDDDHNQQQLRLTKPNIH